MPDIKIVTDVAGRASTACPERPAQRSTMVTSEAMEMEIPVAAPAADTLKSILVAIDDVVAEGQVLAILQT